MQISRQLDLPPGFYGGLGAAGRKTTALAMAWVKNLRKANLARYFVPGCEPFSPAGTKGVRVYVLGPPRDKKLLRKSDPSKKTSEVYELAGTSGADLGFFAAVGVEAGVEGAPTAPFPAWFHVEDKEARERNFSEYWKDEEQWRRIEHAWLDASTRLALQLDSDTNSTSPVLAFELTKSGRVLLFPGDAQVGNWLSWQGLQWQIKEGHETGRHHHSRPDGSDCPLQSRPSREPQCNAARRWVGGDDQPRTDRHGPGEPRNRKKNGMEHAVSGAV